MIPFKDFNFENRKKRDTEMVLSMRDKTNKDVVAIIKKAIKDESHEKEMREECPFIEWDILMTKKLFDKSINRNADLNIHGA